VSSHSTAQAWHHFTPYLIAPRRGGRWKFPLALLVVLAIAAAALVWNEQEAAPKVVRTEIGDVEVSGALSLERATAMLERQHDRFELCFQQAGVPEPGTLSAKVLLGTNGGARLVEVVPGKGKLAPALSCVSRVLGSLYITGGREATLAFTLTRR
jgi:hypothetical protein